MKLAGRVALVTGGSSGIGKAVAERFAAEGAAVAVMASSSLAKARAVADDIRARGGRAEPCVADLSRAADISRVVGEVEAVLGPVDILVNSAGLYLTTPMGETDEQALDRMIQVNLKAPFLLIQAVVPGMKARGRGRIINIASVAGLRGSPRYSMYSATKAGIIMMTRSLARELAPHGVHVNAIAPGNTETPLNASDRASSELMATKRALTPSGRVYSPPQEMAAAALFLASDEVSAMHGATLTLDEGLSA